MLLACCPGMILAQDITPPTATISTADATGISGTAADNIALDRVELAISNPAYQYWNGTEFGPYTRVQTSLQPDGSWQYLLSPGLPPDRYTVVSFAFDSSGNPQNPRDILSFTVAPEDNIPPTAIISAADATSISGTASDNVSLDRVELAISNPGYQYWDGSEFGSYTRVQTSLQPNGSWQYLFSPLLPPDRYTVVSFAFDSSGNPQNPRDILSFTVAPEDNIPPTATITGADATSISGTAADNIALDRVELAISNPAYQYWNGTEFGPYTRVQTSLQPDGSWQYLFSPTLSADRYTVVSFAFDSSGNPQNPRDVLSFTVAPEDNIPPTATITAADATSISGTAADNIALDRVELAISNPAYQYWNGTEFGSYTRVQTSLQPDGSWQYLLSPRFPPDRYTVVSFAFDSSGNPQNPRNVLSFTVAPEDNIPPTAAISNANGTGISGTASDNVSLDRVELAIRNSSSLYWNGLTFGGYARVQTSLNTDETWQYQFSTALPPGSYTVVVFPFDQSQNTPADRDTVSFTVDPPNNFISQGPGAWGNPISLPSIPVSAANLPDGRILTWAAYNQFDYLYNVDNQRTYTTIFNPLTETANEELVANTNHDMFCPGASMLSDGSIMVTGGSSVARTSIFNPTSGSWSFEDSLNIPRAYNSNTTVHDGSVLTLGGSWAEESLCRTGVTSSQNNCPDKLAEIWNPATGWKILPGISADVLRTNDQDGLFRSDNHMWLFAVPGGKVLHAGPSKKMHLLNLAGNGSIQPVGNRSDDSDAMNGNAVMYDVGSLLTIGGAADYENANATNNAFVVEVSGSVVSSRRTGSLSFSRAYHNSVVLPNGEVVVIGGQSYPVPFSDNTSVLPAELWNPITENFRTLASMSTPRNYHSIALLLNDGRIIAGGGGLCGDCSTNHADVEIFSPPYLFDINGNLKTRPAISSAPSTASYGQTVTIQTNSAVSSFVLIRSAVATHSVNNDQRRIPLFFAQTNINNTYSADIPTDPGVVTPGNYMLFALDEHGTPSISTLINIRANNN